MSSLPPSFISPLGGRRCNGRAIAKLRVWVDVEIKEIVDKRKPEPAAWVYRVLVLSPHKGEFHATLVGDRIRQRMPAGEQETGASRHGSSRATAWLAKFPDRLAGARSSTMPVQEPNRQELMNAGPHHAKLRVTAHVAAAVHVAGTDVAGKIDVECRAEKGLGLGTIMVELMAIQGMQLNSRDHAATSTFIHTRRIFQGPGLPPSNAVVAEDESGAFPPHHYPARRGITTFFFRFPLPLTSPASIEFGSGLARIRYEIRASASVAWKGERRLVTDRQDIQVVESATQEVESAGTAVGESGKVWMQAKVLGGAVMAGQTCCIELHVKNHSSRKTTGVNVSLRRVLHLDNPPPQHANILISDTLVTAPFNTAEYCCPPGVDGVAKLVINVPRTARTVKVATPPGDSSPTTAPRSGDSQEAISTSPIAKPVTDPAPILKPLQPVPTGLTALERRLTTRIELPLPAQKNPEPDRKPEPTSPNPKPDSGKTIDWGEIARIGKLKSFALERKKPAVTSFTPPALPLSLFDKPKPQVILVTRKPVPSSEPEERPVNHILPPASRPPSLPPTSHDPHHPLPHLLVQNSGI
ncbi:arrestin [Ceratobasidium sp. AG-Ba]|nr:arrestin [Ceratobasidium sp. AG-Ba]